MVNIGKNWSCSLTNLVNLAMETARLSQLKLRHGAILFSKKSAIHYTCCNGVGDKICGYDVPSLHAEARCLKPITDRASRFGRCYQGRY